MHYMTMLLMQAMASQPAGPAAPPSFRLPPLRAIAGESVLVPTRIRRGGPAVPYQSTTGYIVFEAKAAGRDVSALLDNLASSSILDLNFAREADLPLIPIKEPMKTWTGEMAEQRALDVPFVIPGHFETRKPFLVADLKFISDTSGRKIGAILGGDVIDKNALLIEPVSHSFRFGPPGKLDAPAGGVKLNLRNARPQIELSVGGKPVLVSIDLGSNGMLDLSPEVWTRVRPEGVVMGRGRSASAEGNFHSNQRARLEQVTIGPLAVKNIDVVVRPIGKQFGDGIVGMGLLSRFTVLLDNQQGALWLAPIIGPGIEK